MIHMTEMANIALQERTSSCGGHARIPAGESSLSHLPMIHHFFVDGIRSLAILYFFLLS